MTQPRRFLSSSFAALVAVFLVASMLGGIADAAPTPVRKFRATMTPCVVKGTHPTMKATIKNDNTGTNPSNQPLGSAFFDTALTAFSGISPRTAFTVSTSTGKNWTALLESDVNASDKNDLDGIYIKANSTLDALAPGETATVNFPATASNTVGNRFWTVSAWQNITPRVTPAFTNSGGAVSTSIANSCPAATLSFSTQPPASIQACAGSCAGMTVAVTVLDGAGNPVINAPVTLSLNPSTNAGVLAGTLVRNTNGSGIATFPGLSVNKVSGANPYSLHAAVSGTVSGDSSTFTVTAGSAATLSFSTQPPASIQACSGSCPGMTVAVTVLDGAGNPVPSTSVTLSLNTNGNAGVLAGTLVQSTDSSGVATFPGLSVNQVSGANPYSLRAVSGAASGDSSTFTVTHGAVTTIAFTTGGQPTNTLAGDPINGSSGGVQVLVTDGTNPAPGETVTMDIDPAHNPGSETLAGTLSAVTDSNGVATFSNLSIGTSASGYKLRATDGALSVTSATFDITSLQNPDAVCSIPDNPQCTVTQGDNTINVQTDGPAPQIIFEPANADLGCNSIVTRDGAVQFTIEPGPGATQDIKITLDFNNVPVAANQGFYPVCKSIDTESGPPSAQQLHLCSNSVPVPCINSESLQFTETGNTLHTVFTIHPNDPHGKQ
jgi:hypothetical protein